jgi:NADH:ubiquinone oxidoreductase subunit 5 (subunit L)/multisubunit Na+/H+ antiporter MnhA subunit
MKKSNNDDNDKNHSDNNDARSDSSIFYIMDGIIDQLNKTKKLFIIMLLTIMIIPPIAFMLSFMLFGFPFHDNNDDSNWTDNKPWSDSGSNSSFNPSFRYLPLIPIIVVIVWMGIGIRQWFILSKWDKKYKKYKELQTKINEELEKDDKSEPK